MKPYYSDESVTLLHGDCLDVLRDMADNSVDAVVCDPPYGLANTTPEQVSDTLIRWINGERDYLPEGAGFMGKSWDAFVPPVAVWDDCMRVLKPGGHLLAFAGSRTHDLMALGIRLAGFDIRDSIAWLYGSGFPKSLDVSKAIDKLDATDERRARALEFTAWFRSTGITRQQAAEVSGMASVTNHYFEVTAQPSIATADIFDKLRPYLPDVPERIEELVRQRTIESENYKARGVVTELGAVSGSLSGRVVQVLDHGTPQTSGAQQWQGWGTALKPAFEPIVVARKPLGGTVAANVLEWGTGAMNVDGCRVGLPADDRMHKGGSYVSGGMGVGNTETSAPMATGTSRLRETPAGRWPANVLLDGSQADRLDAEVGTLTSGKMQPTHTTAERNTYGQNAAGGYTTMETYGDSGGASRFFPTFRYQAKAPTRERIKVGDVAHPTVKPLALMRWLVRLVTPPGGVVLDPFAGSGTTIEAAILEGFRVIGIEREADYLPLIEARIARATPTQEPSTAAAEALALFDLEEPA